MSERVEYVVLMSSETDPTWAHIATVGTEEEARDDASVVYVTPGFAEEVGIKTRIIKRTITEEVINDA